MAPPFKRRKLSQPEEISFDPAAREDYLKGFRRRKQQRIKQAKDVAAKKEREAKIEDRKHIREQRQKELDEHVANVNRMVRSTEGGFSDGEESSAEVAEQTVGKASEHVSEDEDDSGHEDEYVDEDRYTTVTVAPLDEKDRDFGSDIEGESGDRLKQSEGKESAAVIESKGGVERMKERSQSTKPKKKRRPFRYESKTDRKQNRVREKAKKSKAADRRRGGASTRK